MAKASNLFLYTSSDKATARQAMWWVGLLILGVASTLVLKGGYTLWPLLATVWGWAVAFKYSNKLLPALESHSRKLFFQMTGAFLWFALTLLLTNLYHRNSISELEGMIPFVLYPGIFFAVIWYQPRWIVFSLGAALGAIFAFVFAAYQVWVMGLGRAEGHIMAISFGDLAVALAAVSLLAWIHGLKDPNAAAERGHKWWQVFHLMGFVFGAMASVLSGSKGGWLSLLTLLAIAVSMLIKHFKGIKRLFILAVFSLAIVAVAFWMPKSVFVDRIQEGVRGAITYVQTGQVTDGSVSIRFEMWKLGIDISTDAPLLGHGIEGVKSERVRLVSSGAYQEVNHSVLTFENELINRWAISGVVGVLATLVLFLVPFFLFWKHRHHPSQHVRTISAMGWVIPIFFFEFGLSVSMFGINAFRQVYASWLMLLLGLLVVEIGRHAQTSNHRAAP